MFCWYFQIFNTCVSLSNLHGLYHNFAKCSLVRSLSLCTFFTGEMLPKGLALEVVRRHGVGLELATKTGCDSVELDTKCRTLNCKGNVPNIDALLREIEDCSQQLTRRESSLFVRSSDCCSCFTEVTADSLRLENCGHLFCMECLALQIQTYMEAKRFPISCAAEACETCISVCDILTICNRNSIELARLIACSLNCHLARNRHRVRPCPTTDCPMFYNVTADPEEFICPKCKKALCSACHEVSGRAFVVLCRKNVLAVTQRMTIAHLPFQPFHTGLSCDIKREIECLEDKKLKSWIQEQPKKRKMCPKCKSGIEKQMGCSNVHCASCHTYICWLCLKVSPTCTKCVFCSYATITTIVCVCVCVCARAHARTHACTATVCVGGGVGSLAWALCPQERSNSPLKGEQGRGTGSEWRVVSTKSLLQP